LARLRIDAGRGQNTPSGQEEFLLALDAKGGLREVVLRNAEIGLLVNLLISDSPS